MRLALASRADLAPGLDTYIELCVGRPFAEMAKGNLLRQSRRFGQRR